MVLPFQKERIPLKNLLLYGLLPSIIKKVIYRLKGYVIGEKVKIGFGSVIIAEKVLIGDNVKIGFLSILRAKKIEIGSFSSIASFCYLDAEKLIVGTDTRIREQVYSGGLKTPDSELIIGDRCLIAQMTYFNPTMPIIIGNDTSIGGHSQLFTHSSWLSQLEGFPVKFGPIKIGNNVWGSWRSFITSGVEIGDYVILQPNSVITKNIPQYSIFSSNPTRIIPNFIHKSVTRQEQIKLISDILLSFIKYLEYHKIYLKMENNYYSCIINKNIYRIIIHEQGEVFLSSKFNNILITFLSPEEINISIGTHDMLLFIENKSRYGSNLLGEELIHYFSRYGIRFKRIKHNI